MIRVDYSCASSLHCANVSSQLLCPFPSAYVYQELSRYPRAKGTGFTQNFFCCYGNSTLLITLSTISQLQTSFKFDTVIILCMVTRVPQQQHSKVRSLEDWVQSPDLVLVIPSLSLLLFRVYLEPGGATEHGSLEFC